MKLLIAVALLVVGLSPCPGFSQFGEGSGQTTEALTDAPTEAPTDGKKVFIIMSPKNIGTPVGINKLLEVLSACMTCIPELYIWHLH